MFTGPSERHLRIYRKMRPIKWGILASLLLWAAWDRYRVSRVWPPLETRPVVLPEPSLPVDPHGASCLERLVQTAAGLDADALRDAIRAPAPVDGGPLRAPAAAEASEALDTLLACPGITVPLRYLHEGPDPSLDPLVAAARLRLLRARRHVEEGDLASGVADVDGVLHLGELLWQSGGEAVTVATGLRILNTTLAMVEQEIETTRWPPETAHSLARHLRAIEGMPSGIAAAIAGDCMVKEAMLASLAPYSTRELLHGGGGLPDPAKFEKEGERGSFFYDAERSRALLRARCHRRLEVAHAPRAQHRFAEEPRLFKRRALSPGQLMDNPIGRHLIDTIDLEPTALLETEDRLMDRMERLEATLQRRPTP